MSIEINRPPVRVNHVTVWSDFARRDEAYIRISEDGTDKMLFEVLGTPNGLPMTPLGPPVYVCVKRSDLPYLIEGLQGLLANPPADEETSA